MLRGPKRRGSERVRSGRTTLDVRSAGKQLACYELEGLLGTLGAGALNGRFTTKHRVSRRWTTDFYVPEIKLAIEVEDSAARRQLLRRAQRRLDCGRLGITLVCLTDAECRGDRDALVNKLRGPWKKGLQRRKHQTSSRTPAVAACVLLGGASVVWLYPDWVTYFPQPAAASEIIGRASVIDGDTLEIRGERIRLHGIDAPESAQTCADGSGTRYRCGQRAALALADKVGAGNVRCDLLDRDSYGRHIGRCSLGEVDLNEWMVGQGQAVAYRRYSTDYVQVEAVAQDEGIGIWQGKFELPWHWRQANQAIASGNSDSPGPAQNSGCTIKGNISENRKIYHLPGQRFYDQTRISPAQGERWFCSEAEARAAGWRRARQ